MLSSLESSMLERIGARKIGRRAQPEKSGGMGYGDVMITQMSDVNCENCPNSM